MAELEDAVRDIETAARHSGAGALALAQQRIADRPQHWAHYAHAAVMLGLARRAFELATGAARGSMLPGTQFCVGSMRAKLASVEALLYRYASEVTDAYDAAIPLYFASQETREIVALAEDVLADSDASAETIGQVHVDLRAVTRRAAKRDLNREIIGKIALDLDPADRPRWL